MKQKVTEGKHGRLFLDNDTNKVLLQYKGEFLLSEDKLKHWHKMLQERNEYCLNNNIKYYLLIPPDPHSVYPEDMAFEISDERPVPQLLDSLEKAGLSDNVIYPLSELKNNKPGQFPLYPKTDTHWSSYGAFLVYQLLAEKLGITYLKESDIKFEITQKSGDLGNKFEEHRYSDFTSSTIIHKKGKQVFNNHVNVRGRFQVFENDDKSLPKCVWFGTSYTYSLLQFLKESFSTLVFAHRAAFDFDILEVVKPDIVITETAERFIVNPPNDSRSEGCFGVFSEKISKLSVQNKKELLDKIKRYDPCSYLVSFFQEQFSDIVKEQINNFSEAVIETRNMPRFEGDLYTKTFENNFLLKGNLKFLKNISQSCIVTHYGYKSWLEQNGLNTSDNMIVYERQLEKLHSLPTDINKIIIISPFEKCIYLQVEKLLLAKAESKQISCFIRDIYFIRKVFKTNNIKKIASKVKPWIHNDDLDFSKFKSCLVFSLPRSGSSYFADTFGQCNLFGLPREHIQHDIVELINSGFISFKEYFQFVFANTATLNGVVMSKIIDGWFLQIFNHASEEEKSWLKRLIGNSKIIYLERNNKIKQAVSAFKSRNTKLFHSTHQGANNIEIEYDFDSIKQLYKAYIKKESRIKKFLDDMDIDYLHIRYEDFVKSPKEYFLTISDFLGVDVQESDYKPSIYEKVSNKNSEMLIKRFSRDLEVDQ